MFDLDGDMFKYVDSLKTSVDKFMLEKMEMLKKLVRDEKIKMTFELGFVSRENSELNKKIRKMNPYTIDWSNIPDYLLKEDFLAIAKGYLIPDNFFLTPLCSNCMSRAYHQFGHEKCWISNVLFFSTVPDENNNTYQIFDVEDILWPNQWDAKELY